jgi:hypothetical protein
MWSLRNHSKSRGFCLRHVEPRDAFVILQMNVYIRGTILAEHCGYDQALESLASVWTV